MAPTVLAQPAEDPESKQRGTEKQRQKESTGPLRNRIIKTATFEGMSPAGRVSPALVEHHRAVAAGGVAMSTVAYCAVEPDGRTFRDQLYLRPEVVTEERGLTDAVHREGFELCAMGRALIHDPNLVAKYAGGSLRESGCVPCNQCVAEMDRAGGVCCAQVPEQLAARAARARGNLG